MFTDWKEITSRQFKFPIFPIFCQLILINVVTMTAWSQQKSKPDDPFVAEHRQAVQKNPEGLSFTLRITKETLQFKPGEIIPVEFSFTSKMPDSYELYGATDSCGKPIHLDKFFFDQKEGVADPLGDYFYPEPRIPIRSRNECEGSAQVDELLR